MIKKIAEELKLGVVDVYGALEGKDELIPDKVHPNAGGATLIAKAVVATVATKK